MTNSIIQKLLRCQASEDYAAVPKDLFNEVVAALEPKVAPHPTPAEALESKAYEAASDLFMGALSGKPMKGFIGRGSEGLGNRPHSVRCGDRESSLFMSRQRYQTEYHCAELNYVLNGGEEPDLLAYTEESHPNLYPNIHPADHPAPTPQAEELREAHPKANQIERIYGRLYEGFDTPNPTAPLITEDEFFASYSDSGFGFSPVRREPRSATPTDSPADALRDIAAERRRQIESEGWTPEHDDEHISGDLSLAAASYALNAAGQKLDAGRIWPWSQDWWKPADRRRSLVKAGALIVAEIERLDRAAQRLKPGASA